MPVRCLTGGDRATLIHPFVSLTYPCLLIMKSICQRGRRALSKVLFDFADIESYYPDGTSVPANLINDSCPWCQAWCDAHPGDCANLDTMGDCAHTHPLLCKLKGGAFWWMMARLAGRDGQPMQTVEPYKIASIPNPTTNQTVTYKIVLQGLNFAPTTRSA